MSKLACPETEESKTSLKKKGSFDIPESEDVNVVHAASNGATMGMQLVLNIGGTGIAALAILGMLDSCLNYLGKKVDVPLSFSLVCEVIFFPAAWLMGVDGADCLKVARCLGLKIFANEIIAYIQLKSIRDDISERSFYIASYALCGFSNFASIGIQLGGISPLAPNQVPKLAKLIVSAMFVGNTGKISLHLLDLIPIHFSDRFFSSAQKFT